MILYNLFYLNIELRNKYILSEISPKIAKATDNQWLLSGWQDCFSPTTPKLNPKAPADRTTARTCHEQKKPDYCRAFLSGWQDFLPLL